MKIPLSIFIERKLCQVVREELEGHLRNAKSAGQWASIDIIFYRDKFRFHLGSASEVPECLGSLIDIGIPCVFRCDEETARARNLCVYPEYAIERFADGPVNVKVGAPVGNNSNWVEIAIELNREAQ